MSEEAIERIRVTSRGYELGQNGVLPVATYLRYLEHSRWRTIARSEKLPLRQFFVLGVVRAQSLELSEQIGFDVELEISVWLSRLGRTSMTLSHEIVRVSDAAVVGRSSATIVALDADRRPSPIDESARRYVLPREGLAHGRFEGDVPDSAFERAVDVRPSDQDLQQHVNHARYADFVEDTRWFLAQSGRMGGSWDDHPRAFDIVYERECRVGDRVVAKAWPTAGRERSLDFLLAKGAGETVVRARVELGRR